ncbi:hypothetical protein [Nocardia colli]|uniref:hypothetical protein n=1 Tax=Nocardia colli TaxID=2545717 RepID=UPI0035DF2257
MRILITITTETAIPTDPNAIVKPNRTAYAPIGTPAKVSIASKSAKKPARKKKK